MTHGSASQLETLFVASLVVFVQSHSRFVFPTPRSPNTGIKNFPCGAQTGDFNGPQLEVQPGPLTVVFEESIAHTGSPWRISLSEDADDSQVCVLLDHIPHDDNSRPRFGYPSTYHEYAITIDIPNVACERCSLHLANPMTDKIGSNGAPDGSGCTDPGSCFSVYYSCSTPLHISGSIPRAQYSCPGTMPSDWPQVWIGDGGRPINAITPGTYRRESASWGLVDEYHWLLDVPAKYRELAGNLAPTSTILTTPTITTTASTTTSTTITTMSMSTSTLILNFTCGEIKDQYNAQSCCGNPNSYFILPSRSMRRLSAVLQPSDREIYSRVKYVLQRAKERIGPNASRNISEKIRMLLRPYLQSSEMEQLPK